MVKRSTTTRDRHRAAIRQGQPPCGICGKPIDYTLIWADDSAGKRIPHPRSFVVDHIISLARGGTDTLDNKQAAHRDCNRTKGDRDFALIPKRSASLRLD